MPGNERQAGRKGPLEERPVVTRGSGNIFADLGLPGAEDHLLKAQIVLVIGDTIRRQGLTQAAVARRMGVAQPDVSKLLKGRFDGFSLERLLGFLLALGHGIKIEVEPASEDRRAGQLRLAPAS